MRYPVISDVEIVHVLRVGVEPGQVGGRAFCLEHLEMKADRAGGG